MKNRYVNLFLVFVSLFLLLNVTIVFAYELEWPNSPAGTSIGEGTTITTLVKYIYEWGISLGILFTFIAIVIAGFTYMTSTGNPSKISEAQGNIKDAFIGLALLLSSWLILNTINPALTNLTPPSVEYENKFDPLDFNSQKLPEGQCSVVHFWEEKNFIGEPKERYDFDIVTNFAGLGRFNPALEVFMDLNPKSFIAYRKLITTGEDKQAIEMDKALCEAYKKENEKYCTGTLIKDDSCIVELYAAGPFWDKLSNDGCGDKLLSIPGAVKNVDKMLANPTEKLECYKAIKGDE